VIVAELTERLPSLRLAAGSSVQTDELDGIELLIVDDGLVVLRGAVPGSARRAITCHAGRGAFVLPPSEGESLVALTDATVLTISAETRDRLLESPQDARVLVDGLAESLRRKHAALASLARLHHVDRVREKLMELAREHGRVGRDGIRLDFPLTHDLLGEMTGSARETVTRALDELQREGFVVRQGRTYSLRVSPEELGRNGFATL